MARPDELGQCEGLCTDCLEDTPSYCTACKEGAELSNTDPGLCVCKPGYVAEHDAAHCQKTCEGACKSCLLSDPAICTSCIFGYVLTDWATPSPSTCVHWSEVCPDNCCKCEIHDPVTCVECCPGFNIWPEMASDKEWACVDPDRCHDECLTCLNPAPDSCLSCYPNASIAEPLSSEMNGYCTCNTHWLPAPDAAN